ncbi:type IV secretion system protein [Pollutimonas bauzanensis]|uniref:Type IV secretion system protein VirB6 n=1 Tax=Pollutimonas bauzanensis TaxID=658167 RepID=A0A1M5YHX8_9BURK|nr:type IV secretion system protein [Pollutimonas bauzanensis]SHI11641.1 type IV secretion system protein VirB6 [Pollutimonas bauzanensis]
MAIPAPATLYSLGSIVQWIDESLNTMLINGVADNVERLTGAIWLPLELGVTIGLMTYGWMVAAQRIPTPYGEALVRIFRIVVVVAIIESGGFYQSQIMGAMLALPDGLMQAVTGEPASARDVLADFHNSGLETATRLDERAPSVLTEIGQSILFALVSLVITVIYTLVTIMGILMMSVAKVGMALIVMVGPLFIAALLFDHTKEFFKFWLQQALYFALYGTLFTLVFGLVMGMLGYVQNILLGMTTAAEINVLQILGVVILVAALAMFLMKLPSVIVGKITGGSPVDMPFIGQL